jgi:acetylornithine deacetylase/succinyl-diaminopimelate desuccinylase-like protein
MTMRHDAFAGAVEVAALIERLAQNSPSGSTVATVGVVHVRPGAINVIPGEAELHIDIRDHDLTARTAVVDAFGEELKEIAARRGLSIDVETIRHDHPAACDIDEPYLDVISGAYHDAMILGPHVPIGMIFVPSAGGISHSPLEYTAPEDLDRGVRVLAATLRRLADDN